MPTDTILVPPAKAFSPSPLRHRLRLRLDAPVDAVWALVGEHTRLPEYSSGIARVYVVPVESPRGEARVCHFRPMAGEREGAVLSERVRWYAAGVGYATSTEPGNAFGLESDLSLVTVEATPRGTVFIWDQHYEHADLPMIRASFDEGLADMGANLVRRFGGEVVERWCDGR